MSSQILLNPPMRAYDEALVVYRLRRGTDEFANMGGQIDGQRAIEEMLHEVVWCQGSCQGVVKLFAPHPRSGLE